MKRKENRRPGDNFQAHKLKRTTYIPSDDSSSDLDLLPSYDNQLIEPDGRRSRKLGDDQHEDWNLTLHASPPIPDNEQRVHQSGDEGNQRLRRTARETEPKKTEEPYTRRSTRQGELARSKAPRLYDCDYHPQEQYLLPERTGQESNDTQSPEQAGESVSAYDAADSLSTTSELGGPDEVSGGDGRPISDRYDTVSPAPMLRPRQREEALRRDTQALDEGDKPLSQEQLDSIHRKFDQKYSKKLQARGSLSLRDSNNKKLNGNTRIRVNRNRDDLLEQWRNVEPDDTVIGYVPEVRAETADNSTTFSSQREGDHARFELLQERYPDVETENLNEIKERLNLPEQDWRKGCWKC
ncbi:Hypothetical predicted protein [Lecanosticta acicola]|uniref:Uncharacterized protein n=1 Tax=Lecanosticta acicola TaxID=111012 RepID=A0AAI9EEW7_9PEZI|nr:Hypothetical predicted protein [Lecanosticta acicola]